MRVLSRSTAGPNLAYRYAAVAVLAVLIAALPVAAAAEDCVESEYLSLECEIEDHWQNQEWDCVIIEEVRAIGDEFYGACKVLMEITNECDQAIQLHANMESPKDVAIGQQITYQAGRFRTFEAEEGTDEAEISLSFPEEDPIEENPTEIALAQLSFSYIGERNEENYCSRPYLCSSTPARPSAPFLLITIVVLGLAMRRSLQIEK